MKILPINGNQNKANFRGTVDKSVVGYLNEVRYNALNRPESFFGKIEKRITAETYTEVKTMIEGILSKLDDFMSKTHSKTKILINGQLLTRDICFENTELNSTVPGTNFWSLGTEKEYGTVNDEGIIFLKDPNLKVFKKNGSHTFNELERFDKYIAELTTMFAPEEIDGALFDKKVAEVVKKAEETAPKNRLENRRSFNNLDRLAPKFHRAPIYTEQFHIIQALAYKMQEERAKNPIEQSKEELKNLKIK